jgi:2-polyprenyl-6-methoxyphenol hydroxylase-like FAD-dependent oxidoreductase
MKPTSVLISGGGIAGLTLAILLKRMGWEPTVIERNDAPSTEGYMMDFFGSGWDVAERMGLIGDLNAVHYPIKRLEFVGDDGRPYVTAPIERISRALSHRYVYLRRSDLEHILFSRVRNKGIDVRFGTTIDSLDEEADGIAATFSDGTRESFTLVIGADGIHSRVRDLVFGPPRTFMSYLGYYVAAFHFPDIHHDLGNALKIHEETDRTAMFYPLGAMRADATYLFRYPDVGHVPAADRMALLREVFADAGWIIERVLDEQPGAAPVFFDSATQVVMPDWHAGRVALIGDACGCLTLLAGQGSHMAMAGAYVLARELERAATHQEAFAAYQRFLKPQVEKRQRDAAWFSKFFVPNEHSRPWLRRLAVDAIFSNIGIAIMMGQFGSKSALASYK